MILPAWELFPLGLFQGSSVAANERGLNHRVAGVEADLVEAGDRVRHLIHRADEITDADVDTDDAGVEDVAGNFLVERAEAEIAEGKPDIRDLALAIDGVGFPVGAVVADTFDEEVGIGSAGLEQKSAGIAICDLKLGTRALGNGTKSAGFRTRTDDIPVRHPNFAIAHPTFSLPAGQYRRRLHRPKLLKSQSPQPEVASCPSSYRRSRTRNRAYGYFRAAWKRLRGPENDVGLWGLRLATPFGSDRWGCLLGRRRFQFCIEVVLTCGV